MARMIIDFFPDRKLVAKYLFYQLVDRDLRARVAKISEQVRINATKSLNECSDLVAFLWG